MRHGRPFESGRKARTPGALHLDEYAGCHELAQGWRRTHSQLVWNAMVAVVAFAGAEIAGEFYGQDGGVPREFMEAGWRG